MGYDLIGTRVSQFTGKVRAYLKWKGASFSETLASPEAYRDIIEPRIGYPVIPVLLTSQGETLQDSAAIIDHVEANEAGPSVWPEGAAQKLASLLIELYADEWLVIAAMHYRWSFDPTWILEAYGSLSAPGSPPDEKRRIGEVVTRELRESLPKLGVSEETGSGVEAHYEGFLADFSAHLRSMPYLFGGRPSLADFALFGPLYGPLYLDPAAGARMKALAPQVADWVERMLALAPGEAGELTPPDAIPQTLLPILKRHMAEHLPALVDTARLLATWAQAQPSGARVPTSLGGQEFVIGGRRGERSAMSFSLWRLQRVLDYYQSLSGEDRTRADSLLGAIGAAALADFNLPRRLERPEYRLLLA